MSNLNVSLLNNRVRLPTEHSIGRHQLEPFALPFKHGIELVNLLEESKGAAGTNLWFYPSRSDLNPFRPGFDSVGIFLKSDCSNFPILFWLIQRFKMPCLVRGVIPPRSNPIMQDRRRRRAF